MHFLLTKQNFELLFLNEKYIFDIKHPFLLHFSAYLAIKKFYLLSVVQGITTFYTPLKNIHTIN